MVGNRLVKIGIAIDGVDGSGKSTIANAIHRQYGYPVLSVDIFRKSTYLPLAIRQWGDVPMVAVLEKIGFSGCVFDRSLISVLAYNHDPFLPGNSIAIYDDLVGFLPWYQEKIFFVFSTYYDVDVVLSRKDALSKNDLIRSNGSFRKVYDLANINPCIVFAEDSIGKKVQLIMAQYLEYKK